MARILISLMAWPFLAVGKVVRCDREVLLASRCRAYPPDTPLAAPAMVAAISDSGTEVIQPSMIASDLDAYGRATLEDEQVSRATTTLARVAAKEWYGAGHIACSGKRARRISGLFARLTTTGVATAGKLPIPACWTLLPDHIQVSLLDLPAGSHRIVVRDESGDREMAQVQVEPGRLLVVPVRSFAIDQPVR